MPSIDLISPFIEFGFMRRALVACLLLSVSTAPLGALLLLQRMSLASDAMSHAVLPGIAIAYIFAGLSTIWMGVGGLIAGLTVAMLAVWTSAHTRLKKDATFAAFYLGSLALGVVIISIYGSSHDLLHILFGYILAIDIPSIIVIGAVSSFTLLALTIFYRFFAVSTFDPIFLRLQFPLAARFTQFLLMALVVLNLLAAFQVLGTLMTVGMFILPAATSRLWVKRLDTFMLLSTLCCMFSSFVGLIWSFNVNIPSGPAIILVATLLFAVSTLLSFFRKNSYRHNFD